MNIMRWKFIIFSAANAIEIERVQNSRTNQPIHCATATAVFMKNVYISLLKNNKQLIEPNVRMSQTEIVIIVNQRIKATNIQFI